MTNPIKHQWRHMPNWTRRSILRAIAGELLTLNQAAEVTGTYSGITTYRAAVNGELFTVKIGSTMYTTVEELQEWYKTKRPHDDETIQEKFEQWQKSQ